MSREYRALKILKAHGILVATAFILHTEEDRSPHPLVLALLSRLGDSYDCRLVKDLFGSTDCQKHAQSGEKKFYP